MTTVETKSRLRLSARLESASARVETSIRQHEGIYVAVHLLVFAAFTAYLAAVRPMWFDELFTVSISRLPSFGEMLKAMPADGQPPLQYMLTNLSLHVFGVNAFAARLPEWIAYLCAGILTYRIVRRHSTAIEALFALDLLLCAILNLVIAATARPYGLLLLFTAFTFMCWQSASLRQSGRLLPLCGVAVGIAGAILSHHYGIFHVGVFLVAGEVVRIYRRRRLDWGMVAAGLVGLCALICTFPLARLSHLMLGQAILHSTNFWAKPRMLDLLDGYAGMIGLLPILALPITAMIFSLRGQGPSSAVEFDAVPSHEWAAATALCMLLPMIFALSEMATGYFQMKYAIGTGVGLAVIGGWGLPRLSTRRVNAQSPFAFSSMITVVVFLGGFLYLQTRRPIWAPLKRTSAVCPLILDAPGNLPIVVANAYDYAPDWWYSPPSLQRRLIYLADPSYAEKQPDFLPELSLVEDHAYVPFPIDKYDAFISQHSRFLLLRSGLPRLNWTEARLEKAGWHLSVISRSGGDVLYRVTAPEVSTSSVGNGT